MRKEILNGTPIPYDLSIEELKAMMSSSVMKDFSLACEALSYKNEPNAYHIMKAYVNDKDKYRRLYILKTIFRHAEAVELVDFLENAIASDDFLFVENGLSVVCEYSIKVPESLLISAIKKYCNQLYTAVGALKTLENSNENFEQIIEIFNVCSKCAQKEVISEILCNTYLPQKASELFDLFSNDHFGNIRLIGLKIGKKYGFDVSKFLFDTDGHVKKAAK
jgi:hypothetical protein